ncbi:DUF3189 family protein [Niallia oryzisoli]|uniref:DUF3189 family protein n=1 Tax=Niallia oryzisoli TaxID=1737571 RepID=A0ABZ2CJ05_9BACI
MMIYIYHDYAGTHSTALAAAHHLKILTSPTRKLTKEEILSVPYFNKLTKQDVGKFIFHGKDEEENLVFTLARKRDKLVVPALQDFCLHLEERNYFNNKIIFSNTSPTVPLAMTLGGFFSRGLGIDVIGVPLLVKGAQQSNEAIFKLVEKTKGMAREKNMEKVILIENKEFQA